LFARTHMRKSKQHQLLLDCYFNHLELIREKKLNALNPLKKKILDLVFLNTKNGVFWNVTQYVYERELGSLMTIHKNIHELIADDYLTISFLNGKRNKTVLLSDKGHALIAELGRAIEASTHP
jgi:hypothetical protein